MTSLLDRSEEFLSRSIEDPLIFGSEIVYLRRPDGVRQTGLYGQVRHINLMVDMDSGAEVQHEQISATLRLSSITIGEPEKGWFIKVKDQAGNAYDCYVVEAMPDRTIGVIILKLGLLGSAC